MKHITTTWLLGLGLWAAIGLAQGADRFSYSSDGSEVTDNTTGLVWRRCAEGMTWGDSTCTGSATEYTHEGALQRAQTQTGWRLPNVKELSSIVDRSLRNPAIDPTAFPNNPSNGLFWSSSPHVGSSRDAWVVRFSDGSVDYEGTRFDDAHVRLVK
jgi:hypothetical protein